MQETFASGLNPYSVHGMTEIEQSGLKYRFRGLAYLSDGDVKFPMPSISPCSLAYQNEVKLLWGRICADLHETDIIVQS